MKIAIVTGAAGLIGSEAVYYFKDKFDLIVGIDNDMRAYFFGTDASTNWCVENIVQAVANYRHYPVDIRQYENLEKIFKEYNQDIALVIHTAAQPSHDWAAREPLTDFGVNATGTLHLLELTRQYCPDAVFIFTSTNKVYGEHPNRLPLIETDTRWELPVTHPYYNGIDESMSIDSTKHSVFGASKVAADVMTQEYGRYFGLKTGVFRGGCLTGPRHAGAQLHGFLSYLMKCTLTKQPYTIFGYKGKQVRDNIHATDLNEMFYQFYLAPRPGAVYNAGGGRFACCSMLEAITLCNEITGNKLNYSYADTPRSGDHIWYISSLQRFQDDYPNWHWKYDLRTTLVEMYHELRTRLSI